MQLQQQLVAADAAAAELRDLLESREAELLEEAEAETQLHTQVCWGRCSGAGCVCGGWGGMWHCVLLMCDTVRHHHMWVSGRRPLKPTCRPGKVGYYVVELSCGTCWTRGRLNFWRKLKLRRICTHRYGKGSAVVSGHQYCLLGPHKLTNSTLAHLVMPSNSTCAPRVAVVLGR
jgi:hypothetical protein